MQETEPSPQRFPLHEIIEALSQQLGEKYVFPDKAQQITTTLRQHLDSGAYDEIRDGHLLEQTLNSHLLEVSQDKHLRLFYLPDGVPDLIDENEVKTPEAIERIRQKREQNYGLKKVEILDGNIGYFRFDEFVHPHVAGESMHASMTFLTHTNALIIDLRANGGGEATMVQFLCSYFFDAFEAEHIQLNGLYNRRKNLLQQYWVFPYVPGTRYLDKPMFLLTSPYTFSAAEEFAYNLQQLKRALVVGETTGGGAHAGAYYPIIASFGSFIPTYRAINPISGTNWERVGVQPDLPVAQEEAFDIAYHRAQALDQ